LADCRKEASRLLKREGVALSDTLLAAFQDYRRLLAIVCEDVAQDRWTWRRARETQEGLTLSIQLLEFYMVYADFGSIYELCPDWPLQHVDKNLAMIRTDGQSYADAVFRLLRDQGGFTILRLQMARTEHIKGPGIQYVCPFSFLNETPDVNDLEVFPQPHVIIRTLFDYVIGGLQKMLLERGLSPLTISREFQIVSCRVRAEGTNTPQSLDVDATEGAGKPATRLRVLAHGAEKQPEGPEPQAGGKGSKARSRPMPLTELADRILKSPTKTRKLKSVYGDILHRQGDKSWEIELDGLPENIRQQVERA